MDNTISVSNQELNSCNLVQEPNVSYLYDTHSVTSPNPLSASTLGLMMFLSTLQYQASYLNGQYSDAANNAGKAAFIESGGQDFQNKLVSFTEKTGRNAIHSAGITDIEAGIVLGAAKTIKSRQLDFSGPSIYSIKTRLTFTQDTCSVGLKYEW